MSNAIRPERIKLRIGFARGPDCHLAGRKRVWKSPVPCLPVHLWNPANCGDIGLEIRRDGSWWQDGVRFSRDKLVRLFSTILRKRFRTATTGSSPLTKKWW
jgi:hypothetical protein